MNPMTFHNRTNSDLLMTQLQLALDTISLESVPALLAATLPYIDIVEVGTPMIKRYGIGAVAQVKALAVGKRIVADTKTMDAGAWEAALAFDAGADMMTVLACASDATLRAALDVARARQRQVVADLIGVLDKPTRARQLAALGVDYIGIHTGSDEQAHGANPLADLAALSQTVSTPLVVAGGISTKTIGAVLAYKPAIAIVGSAITQAHDPAQTLKELRDWVLKPLSH